MINPWKDRDLAVQRANQAEEIAARLSIDLDRAKDELRQEREGRVEASARLEALSLTHTQVLQMLADSNQRYTELSQSRAASLDALNGRILDMMTPPPPQQRERKVDLDSVQIPRQLTPAERRHQQGKRFLKAIINMEPTKKAPQIPENESVTVTDIISAVKVS